MKKIGYFIPEFPGQTHIFLWRERQVLAELGIATDIISTTCPPSNLMSHAWTTEAQEQTNYLLPFSLRDFLLASLEISKAGTKRWQKCLQSIRQAQNTSTSDKLRLGAMVLVAGKLVWLAKKHGWSHIHVHSCANAANIAMLASLLGNLSYSMTLHGPTLEVYGSNQKQKWQHATFALVISHLLLKDVQNKLQGFLPEDVVVAPMGVDLDKIQRHDAYLPWSADQPCRIFSCGRLNRVKGHKYLIETVALLQEQGINAYLTIAGEDEKGGNGYRQELEKLIDQKGLRQSVQLLGAVSEDRVRTGLEEAHIFALASLNEGVPVAVMEAMAMEMPVVVTDVGGTSELITDQEDGILVPPQEPKIMTDAIAQILHNQDLALKLSQNSRQTVVKRFNHRGSAETLADCLKKTKTLPHFQG